MTKFIEPTNVTGRDMAYISAYAIDDFLIEIKLVEHWNDNKAAHIKLDHKQIQLFAQELLQIVKDSGWYGSDAYFDVQDQKKEA